MNYIKQDASDWKWCKNPLLHCFDFNIKLVFLLRPSGRCLQCSAPWRNLSNVGSLCIGCASEARDGAHWAYFSKELLKIFQAVQFKSGNLLREERFYAVLKTFDIQENTPIFTINPLLIHWINIINKIWIVNVNPNPYIACSTWNW